MTDRVLLTASLTLLLIALSSFLYAARADDPACEGECERRVINEQRRDVVRPYRAWLRGLRWCESTNDYDAISPGGRYTGAYQFDDQTWRSVGGEGRAHQAGRLEQDFRAVQLRKRRGTAPWPVCG